MNTAPAPPTQQDFISHAYVNAHTTVISVVNAFVQAELQDAHGQVAEELYLGRDLELHHALLSGPLGAQSLWTLLHRAEAPRHLAVLWELVAADNGAAVRALLLRPRAQVQVLTVGRAPEPIWRPVHHPDAEMAQRLGLAREVLLAYVTWLARALDTTPTARTEAWLARCELDMAGPLDTHRTARLKQMAAHFSRGFRLLGPPRRTDEEDEE